jgi:hypothetical protein
MTTKTEQSQEARAAIQATGPRHDVLLPASVLVSEYYELRSHALTVLHQLDEVNSRPRIGGQIDSYTITAVLPDESKDAWWVAGWDEARRQGAVWWARRHQDGELIYTDGYYLGPTSQEGLILNLISRYNGA